MATPYFLILPHDDVLHPEYIATLLAELNRHPQACVAYGDMVCFGQDSYRKSLRLAENPIFDRLMTFFLGGAEAVPWWGVTRTSVRDHRDFPTDRYDGFAVECEWALHLLITGAARHVPRPLYFKRIFGPNVLTASRARVLGHSRERLFEALEDHRARMVGLVRQADLSETMRETVELAAEAAMLRRHMSFGIGEFLPVQIGRSEHIMNSPDAMPSRYAGGIRAMSLLAMSQHALLTGDTSAGWERALAAVEAEPHRWEALTHLSRLQLESDRAAEAMEAALSASAVAPDGQGMRALLAACEAALLAGQTSL